MTWKETKSITILTVLHQIFTERHWLGLSYHNFDSIYLSCQDLKSFCCNEINNERRLIRNTSNAKALYQNIWNAPLNFNLLPLSLISWHFQLSVDKILYFGYIKGFYVELVRFNEVRWSVFYAAENAFLRFL